MVAFVLGNLLVKLKDVGIVKTSKRLAGFQERFGKMDKKMKPALGALRKGWLKMGAVAGVVLWRLTEASPRLSAQMEILNMQTNMLLREFGDALVPVFEIVVGLLKQLYEWFKSLPEPVQNAITFGGALAIVVGLLAGAFAVLSAAASPVTLTILAIAAAGALLYLAFETNFGGIRDVVERVFERIKPLFQSIMDLLSLLGLGAGTTSGEMTSAFTAIEDVATAVFGVLEGLIGGWITQLEGVVDFLTAIFKGDLEGALDGIKKVFEGVFEAFEAVILGPLTWLGELVDGLVKADFLAKIANAGKLIIEAFIKAAQKAIEDAGRVLTDVLDLIGDFLGGSLPERGPLRHIDRMGQELGAAYVANIGTGVERANISRTFNRNFRISNVNVIAEETDLATTRRFGQRLSSEVRRSTSW